MSRSRVLFFILSSALVVPLLMGTLVLAAERHGNGNGNAPGDTRGDDSLYKYLSVFSEVVGLINQAYVDEPRTDLLMNGALDGVTDALDRFSLFVPAAEVPGYLKAHEIGNHLSGILLRKERGTVLVAAVEKGSPAEKAGIEPEDLIARVDGRPARMVSMWEMQEILAGKPGTKVTLEVIRAGGSVTETPSFELRSFDMRGVSEEETQGAHLLHVGSFTVDTPGQVRDALAKLAKADDRFARSGKVLLDLRGVSSGDPEVAYATAKLFASGELGELERRDHELRDFSSNEAPMFRGRVVILVDHSTVGAAEILATILRQKIGAELVGVRTLGYSGHQAMADVSGGRLFFTDAFYTGPDKKPIQESLKPDEQVSERTRGYLEKDVPFEELILRRGVHRLLEEPGTAKKPA